ncbi:hypothetical protein BJV77DRAFT_1014074 [Russula vinacea]|nr:hypothetical protein BJV77DRAFT_1014074 [Russula vinacea]
MILLRETFLCLPFIRQCAGCTYAITSAFTPPSPAGYELALSHWQSVRLLFFLPQGKNTVSPFFKQCAHLWANVQKILGKSRRVCVS